MLNMIPVDIITKHKNLKEAFNNDFFHVVKWKPIILMQ
jgi:hypothetical protein